MNLKTKPIILGAIAFVLVVAIGLTASRLMAPKDEIAASMVVHGAIGGGKENFLADEEVNRILAQDYNIVLEGDSWSNGKMVVNELTYTDENGKSQPYDLAFFSDQRYYEYYQLAPAEGEASRQRKRSGSIALNTPIVFYSWDSVVDAFIREGIVTEKEGTYLVTDMSKLLQYINEGKKWSDIGLNNIYGNINIASTDPVTSSPGATYYGLIAAIMNNGEVTSAQVQGIMPSLQNFYVKSGFMNNTPSDLFDMYLRTGMGAKPVIVDYEKSIIDFAVANPDGYVQVKDRIRILYPAPTSWNSHCLITFNEKGDKYLEALNDPRIQEIAFNRYGFRTGVTGGKYDVTSIGISGVPQDITSVVSGLRMDSYDQIIKGLKEALK